MSSDKNFLIVSNQTSTAPATDFGPFQLDPTPTAEVDRLEARYGPLTESVRDLVDATIRTLADDAEVAALRAEVDAIVARLRERQIPGAAGIRFNQEGRAWNWGNSVVGHRNAIAPPLRITHEAAGKAHGEATLGAAYEGPPGLVHGGVAALLLDHIMGETASAAFTRITFTGTLTMRYLRGTDLGPVRLESWIDREEGRKVYVDATIADPNGITVEATGVFVIPAWAVDAPPSTPRSGPTDSDGLDDVDVAGSVV